MTNERLAEMVVAITTNEQAFQTLSILLTANSDNPMFSKEYIVESVYKAYFENN